MPANLQEQFRRHVAWTSDQPMNLTVERAEGPFLYLDNGTRLIDFISGIAVSSLGHRHPEVIAAITRQVQRYLHVMVYGEFVLEPQVTLAARLAAQLPPELQVVYFTNSGTEANEGAIKLAKKYTRRSGIAAFENSYHGDTHGSLSVTGHSIYRDPFRPLLPDVYFLPFDSLDALHRIDEGIACVMVEPIQGEGGIRVPSLEWMQRLRARCRETGALLIFDEVQTGFGRTGALFAFEHFDVVPDILTVAKAFGGGMPLGGIISSSKILSAFRRDPPLSHVTTFGGHPVSCAAAAAALDVLLTERLPERAREIERRIRTELRHPNIREIRGLGAMLGIEFDSPDRTERIVRRALERGVLLGWTLHTDILIRIAPPLNVPWDVLEQAVAVILEAADES